MKNLGAARAVFQAAFDRGDLAGDPPDARDQFWGLDLEVSHRLAP
ncbi:hypothetical protein E1H18_1685 [Caulobacter sp. RHG1]|nr:hypothetical protein [Caulobacter sp. RHG1]